ncbi:MAG: type II secretion system protein GspL [Gammaproteobacteria bacterium]
MKRLRIGLPPLDELTTESQVQFAWLDRAGQVSQQGEGRLAQWANTQAECFLHPRDSLLTSLELPQLPSAKVDDAVTCAAQALILGPLELMHVAHGPRDSSGLVQVGWLPKSSLEHLGRITTQLKIKVRGLYPAPYALPVSGPASAAFCDGHLLLRHSLQQGAVHPLGQQALDDLLATGVDVLHVADDARWSGTAPGWGLHSRLQQAATGGWGRAAACTALAVAIWALGLNLYAARQVDEGQRLKAQMSQQVRQAFPELPVILNALQQARQQLAARQSGAAAEPGQRFTGLLALAGSSLPSMAGSVESLSYEQGRLQLSLLPDARTPALAADAQALLAQAGFSASRDDQGWTVGPLTERVEADADDEAEDE